VQEREEKTKPSSLSNMKTNESMRKNPIGPCDFTKTCLCETQKEERRKSFTFVS
jgi:hypothetical protein